MNKEMTQKEAREYLNMTQPTFLRYAERFGAEGRHEGRCTFYDRERIEKIKNAFDNQTAVLISRLERVTGGKVRIVY